MRVKTEAKRQEILKAATAEFSQRGFHETTLDDVAKRMGSSKATIYNYFRSKGELFGAMLAAAAIPVTATLLETFDQPTSFSARLTAFARAYVKMQVGKKVIAVQRLLISDIEMAHATIRSFRENSSLHAWTSLAGIFRAEQEKGVLQDGDAEEMARQLRAMLLGDLPLRLLFGEHKACTDEETEDSADSAVRLFLAAYACP